MGTGEGGGGENDVESCELTVCLELFVHKRAGPGGKSRPLINAPDYPFKKLKPKAIEGTVVTQHLPLRQHLPDAGRVCLDSNWHILCLQGTVLYITLYC